MLDCLRDPRRSAAAQIRRPLLITIIVFTIDTGSVFPPPLLASLFLIVGPACCTPGLSSRSRLSLSLSSDHDELYIHNMPVDALHK